MKYEVTVSEQTFLIEVNEKGIVKLNGQEVAVDFARSGTIGLYSLLVNNESFEALADYRDDIYHVLIEGKMYLVEVLDERDKLLSARSSNTVPDSGELPIKAPMPGLVVSVNVGIGQRVEKSDTLLILESMKMENEIKAPRAGVVNQVRVKARESVEQNQVMVVLE